VLRAKIKTKSALKGRKTREKLKRKTTIDRKKQWQVGFRHLSKRRRSDRKDNKTSNTRRRTTLLVVPSFWYQLTFRVRQFNRWQLASIATLVLLFGGAVVYYYTNWVSATSEQAVLTTRADWEAGEYQPGTIDITTTAGSMTVKSGGVGNWDVSTPQFPEDIRGRFDLGQEPADIGTDIVSDGTYLYMIIGGHQPEFFRYNPDLATWKQLANAPTEFYHGSALTYRNGVIYAINGSDGTLTTDATAHFFAYDIATDTWSSLEDAPQPWLYNADLVAAGNNKIYAVQGGNDVNVFVYNITTAHWSVGTSVPDPISGAVYYHPLVYSDVVYSDTCNLGCVYAFQGNSTAFFRFDIETGTWFTGFANAPGTISSGSAMALDEANDVIYAFRGNNVDFMSYSPGSTWVTTPPDPGRAIANGGSMAYLNGFIYATFGGVPEIGRYDLSAPAHWDVILNPLAAGTNADGLIAYVSDAVDSPDCNDGQTGTRTGCLYVVQPASSGFRRFRIGDNAWDSLIALNDATNTNGGSTGAGASICYDTNNNIFISRGAGGNYIHTYNIGTNTWGTSIATGVAASYGSSIACTADNTFYWLRGNNTDDFYQYVGAAFTQNDDFPNTGETHTEGIYYGGALTAGNNNYVYALAGYDRGNFFMFDPAQASGSRWIKKTDLPTASYYTGVMDYDDNALTADFIYAIPGKYEKDFWRYSVANDSWTRIADLPKRYGYSQSIAHDDVNNIAYIGAAGAPGTSSVGIHKFNTTENEYIPAATWISAPIDLDYVGSFTSLTATTTLNGNTITFSTRTSADAVVWSAWDEVEGDDAIDSSPARYIQVKAVLNSAAGDDAPVLSDLTITYEKDSTAPDNPTVDAYADSSEAVGLTDNAGTYYYVNPHFKFTSVTELQSALSGYYVAWTTTPGLDPTGSEAYFQTGSTYTVNTPLQTAAPGPTYYLRVATKDAAGNVSVPVTLYTYTYTGIAQAISTGSIWTSQGDWSTGTTLSNTTATTDGTMRLTAVTNGTWTTEAALPWTVNNGASIIFDGTDTFYILRGTATQTFASYSKTSKTYTSLANYGSNVTTGSSSIYIPANGTSCTDVTGCLFATRGTGTTTFQRYNVGGNAGEGIAANTWTTLDTTDINLGSGSAMAWNGDDTIYLLAGSTAPGINVYKYKIYGTGANNWTQLSSVDQTIGLGGTLVYYPTGAGCEDSGGCLFATRGNNDTDFYKYGITANSWDYVANVPIWIGDGASARRVEGYVYLSRGIVSNDFLRYDVVNNSWEWMADTPTAIYYGSEQGMGYVPAERTLYLFRGYTEQAVYKYDIDENTWADTPGIPYQYATTGYNNAILVTDPATGLIYTSRGNGYSEWWSFDPRTNVWVQLTDIPHNLGAGADGEYVNHSNNALDGIYVLAGTEGQADQLGYFYRYSIVSNTWTRLDNLSHTDGTQYEPVQGADLVFDGTDNIYATYGNGSAKFFSYDITDDIAGDGWTDISVAPISDPVPAAVGTGSCAVKLTHENGTESPADDVDYIYVVRGSGTTNQQVYRYRLTAGDGQYAWTSDVENTPNPAPIAGSACVVDSLNNLLVPVGTTNTNMYVLDPDGDANGVWTTQTVLQTYSAGDMAAWDDPATPLVNENVIFGARGGTTSALDRYVVATVDGSGNPVTGFERRGTWTSGIIDFNSGGNSQGVYGYSGLELVMTEAADTSYTIETRTCSNDACADDANNVNWGSWTDVTNNRTISGVDYSTVASTVARYGQVKVSLKSDQVLTPLVDSVTWKYYLDAIAPDNPSAPVSAFTDDDKVTSITDDDWANDLTPYFEWTTSDNAGGIGLNGFYVYFGTDVTKDPVNNASDATNLAYVNNTNFYSAVGGTTGSWFAETQSRAALTSGTYYLRLKTVDRSNNITDSAVTAFTFKVDNGLPSKPTGLSVNPSSYSSTNSYAFAWSASSDTGGSGVLEYCYKVGEAGTENCTSSLSVSGVQAADTRGNTFYLRSHDNANNYSSDYATIVFYYAGDAPTAPQNLTADPSTTEMAPQQDTNSFSFEWNLPATCLGQTPCDAADIQRYCYTINEVPSPTNCGTNYGGSATPSADGGWTTSSQTSTRILPSFSAAKIQGMNTIYVVALDVINNIDYDNTISLPYYFSSNAPGIPAGLQAIDSSDRAANRYSITLTWDEPEDVGSGVAGYNVYRCEQSGTNCDSPSAIDNPPANYVNIATVNTLGYLDTGLDKTITYQYLVRATGSGDTISGNSAVVAMKPEGKFKSAPLMSGQPSAQARIRSATIQWLTLDDTGQDGELIAHPASSFVEYGTTSGYGGETGTSELVNEHEVALTGLTADTTYHYKVKWTDVDGNEGESSDYTFETLGAPSAPINLTATPTTNTSNSFKFSWSPPTDEGVTVSGYFFVVNTIPTADNVQFTTSTSFGPYAAATQQGKNTFYVVAVDDSGNVDYSSYASVDFEAYTTPPGLPRNTTIIDSSDRDAKRFSITLTWDAPISASGEVQSSDAATSDITYTIYRSDDDGATYTMISETRSTGYLDTGLNNEKKYTYKIVTKDSAGASSVSTTPVSKKPEGRFTQPPAFTVAPSVTPDSFSASVKWETERVASSFVEFGLTKEGVSKEQGTADLVIKHEVKVTGLKASTKYYYQVKSIDVDENIALSEIGEFITLEAPKVSDVKISDIRLSDTMITWSTNKEATAVISYGTTANYGLSYTDLSGSYALAHTVKLENLKDGTMYHLRIGGQDRNGNPIASDDYTFTTLTFPKITEVSAKNKSAGQTEVTWKTNVPTTSSVEYYGDVIPPKTQGNTALVTEHSILLYGLEDATRYKYKVRGADQFGYEAISPESEFTTLEDTTPPEVFGVKSESNTIGSGESSKIQIIISWKTNEPTTSQVDYGVGLSGSDFTDQTEEAAELVMEHLVVIAELSPAKTYHFRVVSKDKAGNQTKSGSYSVLTSRKRESFLQLIIGNLEETFSWVGNIGKLF
jgi:hypothetical protein